MKGKEQRKKYPKTKESKAGEKATEYESKLEQIVYAVKEGFKAQNDFLTSMLKGTEQEKQNTPASQIQQARQTTGMRNIPIKQPIIHQVQQSPRMYEQNFPQISQSMQPANAFQTNQHTWNMQSDAYAMNNTRQELP